MNHLFAAAALGIAAVLASPASASDTQVGDLRIEHPWARATPGRAPNGAAYMTLVNEGSEPDRLLSVSSPVAERAALHGHRMVSGVMEMRRVEALEVVPGSPVVLRPGGLHLMLMGLKAPLEEGERFPLTLTFKRAGPVEVEAVVEKLGAMEPTPDPGTGRNHGQGRTGETE
jgi:copper(I)-binding protein